MCALYSLPSRISTPVPTNPVVVVQPTQVLRAASIAHLGLDSVEAAEAAAHWLNGELLVLPTIAQACEVFGTHYKQVVAARGCAGNHPRKSMWAGLLARSWLYSSVEARAAFARTYEDGIWAALEQATDTQQLEFDLD